MPQRKIDKLKDAKTAKKIATKEKVAAIIDGVAINDMTKEQLEGHVVRLRHEIDKEREERNFYQLERDKMQTFWEVTKEQLQEKKIELRNRDRDLEEAEEKHLAEIKVYKQQVKHIMYQHQCKLADLKTESLRELQEAQLKHEQNEATLNKGNGDLKHEIRELETSHQQSLQNLKLENDEKLIKLQLDLQKQMSESGSKYEMKMKNMATEMESHRKAEIAEIEEKKNRHFSGLVKNHDKAFVDMKNYYNDITVNNLALITTLKEQIESMKTKYDRVEKRMSQVMAENKSLVEPLQKLGAEVAHLNKHMMKYDREKVILASTKLRLKMSTEEIKDLKWELEVTQQKFKQLQDERDDLHGKFVSAIQEVQQKISLKNVMLEHKLQTLEEIVEKKDIQLHNVVVTPFS